MGPGEVVVSVRGGQLGPGVRYHFGARGLQVEAVIPRGWRTSFDELCVRERRRQGSVVAGSVVDGPVGETVAMCREPEPLVAAIVDTYRLITSAGKLAMVCKSQRCPSKINDVKGSILGRFDVSTFSHSLSRRSLE